MRVPVQDNKGRELVLLPPDRNHVSLIVGHVLSGTINPAVLPAYGTDRWAADNSDWMLSRWLPGNWQHPRTGTRGRNVAALLHERNPAALHVLVESYLAAVEMSPDVTLAYEVACCNGSSVVTDEMMPCGVFAKDPAANAHDYLFDLHHAKATDCFGKVWSLDDANDAYCDIYAAAGFNVIARTRRIGLALFSHKIWHGRKSPSGLTARA